MIARCPVAATAVNGVPELVDHGVTGLLSAPADASELADSILWLLGHSDEARKMGQRARQAVVSAFSVDVMVRRIETLYDQLLAEGPVDAV